jgi:hypothetical protein
MKDIVWYVDLIRKMYCSVPPFHAFLNISSRIIPYSYPFGGLIIDGGNID